MDGFKILQSTFTEASITDDNVIGDIETSFDNRDIKITYDLSLKHYLQRSLYYNTKESKTYEPDFTTIMFKTSDL